MQWIEIMRKVHLSKIKISMFVCVLFYSIPLFAADEAFKEDLKQRLPLYEKISSDKLKSLNNCRNVCITHCRAANGNSSESCGPATCDAKKCSAEFREYQEARQILDSTKQELARVGGKESQGISQEDAPEPNRNKGDGDLNSKEKSIVDKLKDKEKKLKKYVLAGGAITVALGLHARKCCFGPMGGDGSENNNSDFGNGGSTDPGGTDPGGTDGAPDTGIHNPLECAICSNGTPTPGTGTPNEDSFSRIDYARAGPSTSGTFSFLNFGSGSASTYLFDLIKYSFSSHLAAPLFSLTYSPQCEAIVPSFASCATPPYPHKPNCAIFSALAAGAAVQTFNIYQRRKDIKNTRRKLETKPKPCQYNQESLACACALYPDLCPNEVGSNMPAVCKSSPYSEACRQAICRSNPNAEDCVSPIFHPSCTSHPEQCIRLSKILNTCEGPSCHKKIMDVFTPSGGWPEGAPETSTLTALTPDMKEEVEKVVASYVDDPTSSLTGPGNVGSPSRGPVTKEDLARQMNDVLDEVYSGGASPTSSLAGDLGGDAGDESEFAHPGDTSHGAYSEGESPETLDGGTEWGGVKPPKTKKSGLAQQMKKMLNSIYGKKGKKGKNALRSKPLRMGDDYIGSENDNIFFLSHSLHQDLDNRGYFIR